MSVSVSVSRREGPCSAPRRCSEKQNPSKDLEGAALSVSVSLRACVRVRVRWRGAPAGRPCRRPGRVGSSPGAARLGTWTWQSEERAVGSPEVGGSRCPSGACAARVTGAGRKDQQEIGAECPAGLSPPACWQDSVHPALRFPLRRSHLWVVVGPMAQWGLPIWESPGIRRGFLPWF